MKYALRCVLDRINSRRRKEKGTSAVSGGDRTHFLNVSHSVWTKILDARHYPVLLGVLHALPWAENTLWAVHVCLSVAFSLPAWPVGSLSNNGKKRHCLTHFCTSHLFTLCNNDLRHKNDLGSEYNNDLRDVAWRTPLECQYAPNSAPFTILFDFSEPNYSDQLVKVNAWKVIGEKMGIPAKLWVNIHIYTYWRSKLRHLTSEVAAQSDSREHGSE
jgi:hypothetical protein